MTHMPHCIHTKVQCKICMKVLCKVCMHVLHRICMIVLHKVCTHVLCRICMIVLYRIDTIMLRKVHMCVCRICMIVLCKVCTHVLCRICKEMLYEICTKVLHTIHWCMHILHSHTNFILHTIFMTLVWGMICTKLLCVTGVIFMLHVIQYKSCTKWHQTHSIITHIVLCTLHIIWVTYCTILWTHTGTCLKWIIHFFQIIYKLFAWCSTIYK